MPSDLLDWTFRSRRSGKSIKGYRIDKNGRLVKDQKRLDVSARLRQRSSKKVRVVRKGGNMSGALNWYVIRTIPIFRVEFAVLTAITQREHPAMVPFEEKWAMRKNRHRRQVRRYPIFPCYVFAGFRDYREFYFMKEAVNSMAIQTGKHPPIVGLVGMGARPAKLTADEVSMLQAMSLPRATEINLHKALRQGQRAEIVGRGHPFAGHTVTIDSITRSKCKVLLNILGSMKVVEIDASALEAA